MISSHRDFESVLNVIKWPYMASSSTELINPSKDSLNKLMTNAEYLFLVSFNDFILKFGITVYNVLFVLYFSFNHPKRKTIHL